MDSQQSHYRCVYLFRRFPKHKMSSFKPLVLQSISCAVSHAKKSCTCGCHNVCYFFCAVSDDGTTGLCKMPLLLRIQPSETFDPLLRGWDWVRGSISKFRTVCVANISLAIAHQVSEGVQSAPAYTHHWFTLHACHAWSTRDIFKLPNIQISAKNVVIAYYYWFYFHPHPCLHPKIH